MSYRPLILAGMLAIAANAAAQDSVDVTFRYTNAGVPGAWLVGEFNGWNNQAWPMTLQGGGLFTRTARLRIGGNPNPPAVGVPGAWQYKFYYSGATSWPSDPLNPHTNPRDNNNSFIYTKDPTILYLLPNQLQGAVRTSTPVVTAYIFPKVGAALDTGAIALTLDGIPAAVPGSAYDPATCALSWRLSAPLTNGLHTLILSARSSAGGANADTVSFVSQAGYVQILTRGGYATRNPLRSLRGTVSDSTLGSVRLIRNNADTTVVPVTAGAFSAGVALAEGLNSFVALADSAGSPVASAPAVTFTYIVDHAPRALIGFADAGSSIQLSASGSADPDSGQAAHLTFTWSEDPANPAAIGGINGSSGATLTVVKPPKPGQYAFGLIARDPDGNADTTRNYLVINPDRTVTVPGSASNPDWARTGRIYFLFPKAASAEGTLNAAALRLQYIRDMGFSIIWLMPVMKNAYPINNGPGPGYNITDFYTVAPEYGTNQDFKAFVDQAHSLGLKVILDVTPNHSSRFHPWSLDAHQFLQDSRYWSWYEHTIIPHNTNGLGQSTDAAGFVYYSGFSDQLLDLNWNDIDLRSEMINVYKYWIRELGVDGYRFDVYWGPHRRYGEGAMGKPVREALKHVKPDILLLGEDDGTGTGTETIYADYSGGTPGGLDAAYDFKLYFNQIRGFGFSPAAIGNLHAEIDNGGYYPGPDALYMRFMESQDEDRIVSFYSAGLTIDAATTFQRTMPVAAVLFTAPGLPMLWNGQEVGFGYGLSTLDARRRGVIDWNFQGKALLTPHYQKLATIRGQFPAFTQHKRDTNGDGAVTSADSSDFIRVPSTDANLYAFLRPYADQSGLTVVNMSSAPVTAALDVSAAPFLSKSGAAYLNDLYADTHQSVTKTSLSSVPVSLPGYGTAVYTVSATLDTLKLLNPVLSVPETPGVPGAYALAQNYPNPFNPSTVLSCQLPVASSVRLAVYDMLGREVSVLLEGSYPAGRYAVRFDGSRLASGVYLSRLTASPLEAGTAGRNAAGLTAVKKMLLVK